MNVVFICLQEVNLETFESDFKELITKYKCERHAVCIKGKYKRTNIFGNVKLWQIEQFLQTSQGSRSLHVTLNLTKEQDLCISNVHFPAKPGLEGYLEKCKHLASCVQKWTTLNVIVAGDFNDGLSYHGENGIVAGLHRDFTCLGFLIPDAELQKQTCKSFRGNIYNIDHVLARANIMVTYISQSFDVKDQPCQKLPSDHVPVLYEITFGKK